MPSRRRSRQRAVQILFLWDLRRQPVDDAISAYYESLYSEESKEPPRRDAFASALVEGAVDHVGEIDSRISRHAEHWRIERMNVLDRLILRLAVYEFLETPDTPAKVVINEALELARTFSSDDAVRFINGILDAIRRTVDRT